MFNRPIVMIRTEAALVAVLAGYALFAQGAPWWAAVLGLVAPDLSLVAYRAGAGIGGVLYNLAHFAVLPMAGLLVGSLVGPGAGMAAWSAAMLGWILHISVDRALGFGLKGPGGFRDTHLGRIGG